MLTNTKKFITAIVAFSCILVSGCTPVNEVDSTDSSEVQSSSAVSSEKPPSSEASSEKESSEASSSENPSSAPASSKTPVASKAPSSSKPASSKPAAAPASSKPASSAPPSSAAPSSQPAAILSIVAPPSVADPEDGTLVTGVVESRLYKHINKLRAGLSLNELSWNDRLFSSAKLRSDEMAQNNYFEHRRADGGKWDSSIVSAGYPYVKAWENIAAVQNAIIDGYADNSQLAQDIYDGWYNSPSHYDAMVNPDVKEIGLAVSVIGNDVYATLHVAYQ